MTYLTELTNAMTLLGKQPNAIFMGQAVADPGTGMTQSFDGITRDRLLELPVAEEMQLGMAIGMSLNGYLPICIYPRINFLLLAMGQLVLHLDALPRYSQYKPKVIIRTAIAHDKPLDPGHQHLGDYTTAFRLMLKTVHVERLDTALNVRTAYHAALAREGSSLLIERHNMYDK